MKRLLALFVFLSALAFAAPDCSVSFSFVGSGNANQFNNRSKLCYDWRVSYYSEGFSVISLIVEMAPDVNGVPGSWVTFAAPETTTNPVQGVNPNVNIVAASSYFRGSPAWVRVRLASVTGSGTVTGQFYGCNEPGCGSGMFSASSAGSGVTSFNTRTGAVVSASADYTAAQVTNAVSKIASNAFTSTGTVDLSASTTAASLQLPTDAAYNDGHCAKLVLAGGKFNIADAGAVCAAGITTPVSTTNGGTGANMSATGGTGFVVRQTTAGGAFQTIPLSGLASLVAATASIANTETVVTSFSTAPNTFTALSVVHMWASATCTTATAPGSGTFRMRVGPTTLTGTIADTQIFAMAANQTSKHFEISGYLTVRSIVTTTANVDGDYLGFSDPALSSGGSTTLTFSGASGNTFNPTVTNLVEFTYQSGASTSNCSFFMASMEIVRV